MQVFGLEPRMVGLCLPRRGGGSVVVSVWSGGSPSPPWRSRAILEAALPVLHSFYQQVFVTLII